MPLHRIHHITVRTERGHFYRLNQWCAFDDNRNEEGDPRGYGMSEAEAIAQFLAVLEERYDEATAVRG